MSRSLGILTLDLIARTSSFEQGMGRAQRRVGAVESDLNRMIARADKAAMALATFAAGAAAGMVALTARTARAMDATSKMADQIGTTTEALTGLRFAAQQFANVSDQQFDMALRRMTRRIEEAAQGSGGAKAAFDAMGLSAKELSRLSADEQFMRIADAMQKTDTQAQRLKNTMAIFDTEGMPLVTALVQGSEELERNIELATRYGVVLSTQAAKSAEQFSTNLSRLGFIQTGLRQQMTTALLPALERASGYMLSAAEAALEMGNSTSRLESISNRAVEAVDELAKSAAGLYELGSVLGELFTQLDDYAGTFSGPFTKGIQGSLATLNQSFSESVLATAKEIDAIVGFAGGVAEAWSAVGENIPRYFELAWSRVLISAAEFVNSLADLINPMLRTLGMDGFDGVSWGADTAVAIRSISEAYKEGRDNAISYVDAQGRVRRAMESVAASTAEASQALGGSGAGGGAGGGGRGLTKSLSDAQRAAQAFTREREQALRAQYAAISAIHAEAQSIEDQVLLFGLAKTAVEDLTIARLEEQAVLLDGLYGDKANLAVEAIEREIEARKRLRTAIGSLEHREAEQAHWDEWARDMDQVFQQVGQSFTDIMFREGRSARDQIRDLFKNLTLRVAIQPVMGALQGMVTQQLGGLLGYQNPAQGGIMGAAQSASSLYSAASGGLTGNVSNAIGWVGEKIGSTALQTFASGMAGGLPTAIGAGLGASLGTTIGTSAAAITKTTFAASLGGAGAAGGAASGLGAAVGAALPWVGGALALGSLFGGGLFDREPTTRRGQRATAQLTDGEYQITDWDSRQGDAASQAALELVRASVEAANATFEKVGVDAAIQAFHGVMESSYKGDLQGVASGGFLRVGDAYSDIGALFSGDMTKGGFGGWSEADMLPRLATDIQLTILEAFQKAGVMSHTLDGIDIRGLDDQAAQALSATIQAMIEEVEAFQVAVQALPFANLRDLSFAASEQLIRFAGGLQNLDAGMTSYFQNFYSEAEQLEWATQQMNAAFAGLGMNMPDVTQGADAAKQQFREIVESIDASTESGARAFAMMMNVAGGFHELVTGLDELRASTDGVTAAVRSAADIAKEREQLELRVMQLVGDVAGIRERELSALDVSNHSLQYRIWALEKEAQVMANFGSQLTRAMQAVTTGGELADRLGGMLGHNPVWSVRREQELWASIGSASYEQQIEMAGELTNIVMARISKEQEANRARLSAVQQELSNATRLRDIGQSLQNYLRSLESSNLAPYSLAEKVGIAESELASLVSAARSGDDAAARQVQGALQNALTLWRDYGASGEEYQDAYRRLTSMVGNFANAAVSDAERQIRQLEAQAASLSRIDGYSAAQLGELQQLYDIATAATEAAYAEYELTKANAMTEIQHLEKLGLDTARLHDIAALIENLPALIGAQINSATSAEFKYLAANPDLMQHYGEYGSTLGLDNHVDYARWHYDNWGKDEGRPGGLHGSHADGLWNVPFDGYRAELHAGERVLTATQARSFDAGGGALLAEVRSLKQEVVQLRQQNESLARAQTEALVAATNNSAKTIVGGVGDSVSRKQRDDLNARSYKRPGVLV